MVGVLHIWLLFFVADLFLSKKIEQSRLVKEVSPYRNTSILVWVIFLLCVASSSGVALMLIFLPRVQTLSTLVWTEYGDGFLIGALILGCSVICVIVSGLVLLAQIRSDLPGRKILTVIAWLSVCCGFLIVSPVLIVFFWIFRSNLAKKAFLMKS